MLRELDQLVEVTARYAAPATAPDAAAHPAAPLRVSSYGLSITTLEEVSRVLSSHPAVSTSLRRDGVACGRHPLPTVCARPGGAAVDPPRMCHRAHQP